MIGIDCALDIVKVTPMADIAVTVIFAGRPPPVTVASTDIPVLGDDITNVVLLTVAPSVFEVVVGDALQVPLNIKAPSYS